MNNLKQHIMSLNKVYRRAVQISVQGQDMAVWPTCHNGVPLPRMHACTNPLSAPSSSDFGNRVRTLNARTASDQVVGLGPRPSPSQKPGLGTARAGLDPNFFKKNGMIVSFVVIW
jgi:hypothetical protein